LVDRKLEKPKFFQRSKSTKGIILAKDAANMLLDLLLGLAVV
jgi:hypothetical protein